MVCIAQTWLTVLLGNIHWPGQSLEASPPPVSNRLNRPVLTLVPLVVWGGQSTMAALTRFMRLLLTLMLQADVSQDAPEVVWI